MHGSHVRTLYFMHIHFMLARVFLSVDQAPVPSSTPKPTEAQPGGPCGPDNGGAKYVPRAAALMVLTTFSPLHLSVTDASRLRVNRCGGSQCCSAAGYCGVGDAWCGKGCQSGTSSLSARSRRTVFSFFFFLKHRFHSISFTRALLHHAGTILVFMCDVRYACSLR